MSAGMSWRFHSDLSDELRKAAVDWARANGLDTDRVPFNALFTIADGQLSTEYVGTDGVHANYTPVTVPLIVPLPEPFASAPGSQHAPREPWRFDVPEVPPHVTALEDGRGWVWVREGAAWLIWRTGTVIPAGTGPFAYRLHDADLIARAPLQECEDPRAAS